jgi:hypothetical protein
MRRAVKAAVLGALALPGAGAQAKIRRSRGRTGVFLSSSHNPYRHAYDARAAATADINRGHNPYRWDTREWREHEKKIREVRLKAEHEYRNELLSRAGPTDAPTAPTDVPPGAWATAPAPPVAKAPAVKAAPAPAPGKTTMTTGFASTIRRGGTAPGTSSLGLN